MKKKIVIIDDDRKIRDLIKQYLQDQGFDCSAGEHGKDLDKMIIKRNPDLIILDLMLPDENGLDICKRLRVNKIKTPIIMLTAKGDEVDRIIGLEMGADDYLPKPFNPRELLARIKAILRRARPSAGEVRVLELGDIRLDTRTHRANVHDTELKLTGTEFEIL